MEILSYPGSGKRRSLFLPFLDPQTAWVPGISCDPGMPCGPEFPARRNVLRSGITCGPEFPAIREYPAVKAIPVTGILDSLKKAVKIVLLAY